MPTLPSSAFAQPHVLSPISLHCVPNFSTLSLPIKRKMEGHDEFGLLGEHFDPMGMGRNREDEYESRSGSDNLDGASGDDQDGGGAGADQQSKKKKKYHRHTPQQIQELEAFFKEYPHPDEKQRMELSRRLRLESKQIKFWFQNRRTQMKTQVERHENMILRQENDRLRAENVAVKNAMNSPICNNCGGPGILGDISYEEHQLRIENARLKEEVNRICSLANKFLGRPLSSLPSPMSLPSSNSGLELAMGRNEYGGFSSLGTTLPMGLDMGDGVSSASLAPLVKHEMPIERSVFLELGMAAMEELIKKAQVEAPFWTSSLDGGNEVFNHEEYLRTCSPCFGVRPNGFVSEASRDTGAVIVNSLALVETLMDANRWAEMFPCLVSRAFTVDVISNGIGGTKNGAMLLMHAELRVLSPLVPPRQMRFIRFCKQHAEGVWAVVDVSIDHVLEGSNAQLFGNCRRLPSGCIMHDMPNGYSKVTWVEHSEFDENAVHHLYRPLITNGIGFGARRWVATLQRHCECLAILMSSTMSGDDQAAINSNGRRSMLKLAQRMTDNFCSGVCASTARKWDKLQVDNVGEDVMVMTRKSMDDPGEPPGVVLSASTSVWMPLSQQRLFDFLRDERLRSEWDILSNGGPMQEMVHIAKGQGHGNCVSLLRANAANGNDSGMLILQETWTDASGSLVVYAPVDIPSMSLVMNGGDSAYVALLPSGFSITPCSYTSPNNGAPSEGGSDSINNGGSLLTVGFQILVSSLPTAKLTVESVETVNNLISCTIQKIKSSLQVS